MSELLEALRLRALLIAGAAFASGLCVASIALVPAFSI